MKYIFGILLFSSLIFSQSKDSLSITYIANEGFLISYHNKNILIDALYKEGFGEYAVPSDSTREKIINGEKPFKHIDLYLITHKHDDHIYAPYVINFLKSHKETSLIAADEVTNQLIHETVKKDQLNGINLKLGASIDTIVNTIQLKAIRLKHYLDQTGNYVSNLAYLINIDGAKFFHVGDYIIEFDSLALDKFPLENENIDLMFSGYFDSSKTAQRIIKNKINPGYLAAMHMQPKNFAVDSINFINIYPNGIVLKNEMDTKNITPKVQSQYLGQTPPGDIPVVFARGIISSDELEHSTPIFSPDGNEVYWFKNRRPKDGEKWDFWMETMHRDGGNKWTTPEVAKYNGQPFFSHDGKRLYFDNLPSAPDQEDAPYYVEKQNDNSWGEIKSIKLVSRFPEIQFVSHISLSKNGNLYFLGQAEGMLRNFGIYKSEFVNGEYTKPELLPECINAKGTLNWTPFIAPDESYLLFASSRQDTTGNECDLYISFRNTNGTWSKAYSLGEPINSKQMDRFPAVSLDGKYLFFTRWTPDHDFDVFWVSAKRIYELKKSYESKDYYLGQTPPGDEPVIFSPGIVSVDNKNSHALTISPDGNMIIFSRYPDRTSYILSKKDNSWTGPEQSFFYGKEVSFSPDGKRIYYYTSNDIYYVEKNSTSWSQPIRLGSNIITNNLTEYYPCIVKSGDLYFSRDGQWATARLMRSKFVNGEFQKAEDLGSPINSGGALHAWVSPDESYILFNSPRTGSYTQNDIWISFKKNDGKWSEPKNLGSKINSGADAILCPTVSPDGKYMFFTKLNFGTNTGYIYWVSTSFIDSLKKTVTSLDIKENETGSLHFKLNQNYLNPFNPSKVIRYDLPAYANVKLRIFNIPGVEINPLVNSDQIALIHSATWNGKDKNNFPVSSGVYFCSLITNPSIQQKKMVLIR